MKLKIKNFKKAFTLIEMMVALGVIAVLSTMVLAYTRSSQVFSNLIRETERLIFELRRAQNLSMLVFQETAGSQDICGWGIYLNRDQLPQTSYILFSDNCLPGSSVGNQRYDSGEEKETINLLKGIEIFKSNVYSVVFVPPEPRIKFFPSLGINENAYFKIRLQNQPERDCYKISISAAGQISKEVISVVSDCQ